MLWQSWPFFGICGVFGALWPLESLFCGLLLVFLDKRLWHPGRLVVALLLGLGACGLADWRFGTPEPEMPP